MSTRDKVLVLQREVATLSRAVLAMSQLIGMLEVAKKPLITRCLIHINRAWRKYHDPR